MQDYRMREIFKPTMAELGLCIFQLESFLQVHFEKRRQHFVLFFCMHIHSLRKHVLWCHSGFTLMKWLLRNEQGVSILMMCDYPDLGSASDWLCHLVNLHFSEAISQGKPVVALRNVRCFIMLVHEQTIQRNSCIYSIKHSRTCTLVIIIALKALCHGSPVHFV